MKDMSLRERAIEYLNARYGGKAVYLRINGPGQPDLFIGYPVYAPSASERYQGLLLNIQPEGTQLKNHDDTWRTASIAKAAVVLEDYARDGYVAQFACGLDELVTIIDSFFTGDRAL
ncbi:hypothetical protein ACSCB1_35320 [Streptomyces europaeiscabiei]|uniref:hypothetical protein n=1 Tax=Streptomyces europaeiscabiei TaxID=146819 RepID=UPI000B202704|nr:hypothetical protein [Streptomyces europaeiscabiei]